MSMHSPGAIRAAGLQIGVRCHCEERSDEAIHSFLFGSMNCFACARSDRSSTVLILCKLLLVSGQPGSRRVKQVC
jgi:hypothetical protein